MCYKMFVLLFQRNSAPLFFISRSRSSSFSEFPRQSQAQKFNRKRDSALSLLFLLFFCLKVLVAMRFTANTR